MAEFATGRAVDGEDFPRINRGGDGGTLNQSITDRR